MRHTGNLNSLLSDPSLLSPPAASVDSTKRSWQSTKRTLRSCCAIFLYSLLIAYIAGVALPDQGTHDQ